MKRKKKSKIGRKFEENYFQGWFKGAVGNFTISDLKISRRWFWGWLKKLNQYVPMMNGKGKMVLEIGCSIGGMASLLSERGFEVYASDISKYAVDRASKLSPNVRFFIFDIQKEIPLKEKFDIIIAFEVVEHLNNPKSAIKNMYKSLKAGGLLVISTPYPYPWAYSDPTHISVKYPHEWKKIMEEVGLKNTAYHRFSLLPFFYRFHKRFHIIFPFSIPLRFVNSPIFFIGKRT